MRYKIHMGSLASLYLYSLQVVQYINNIEQPIISSMFDELRSIFPASPGMEIYYVGLTLHIWYVTKGTGNN